MFCTKCGKENSSDSRFCAYCGNAFAPLATQNSEVARNTRDEMDFAYYQANLKMQQEALRLKEQELKEMRRQTEQQRKQYKLQQEQYDNVMKCPWCGSTSLSGNKKGYGVGKGLVGAALLGPVGLIAGTMGSKKVIVTCLSCGHKFKR